MKRLLTALYRIENAFLIASLSALALLACWDIASRVWALGDFTWIAPLLRLLVLWLGLQGAMIATRESEHITVDVLGPYLPKHVGQWVRTVTHGFAAAVCALLAFYATEFVQMSLEYGDTTFSDLPAWPFQFILPFAFAVMALRFAVQSVQHAIGISTTASTETPA